MIWGKTKLNWFGFFFFFSNLKISSSFLFYLFHVLLSAFGRWIKEMSIIKLYLVLVWLSRVRFTEKQPCWNTPIKGYKYTFSVWFFQVKTAVIIVAQNASLDYEVLPEYNLQLIAVDNPVTSDDNSVQFKTSVPVSVIVLSL